ncbi:hypothetical protein SK128_008951 [Halocaridina rubra]|uniref:Uncharacterized protein n=1 Tax=Halocaridina rubra TaxID=373956 RepID=A0AAN9ADV5_HALRR
MQRATLEEEAEEEEEEEEEEDAEEKEEEAEDEEEEGMRYDEKIVRDGSPRILTESVIFQS